MNNKPLYLIAITLVLLVRTQTDQMTSDIIRQMTEVALVFIAGGICILSYREFVVKKDEEK